MPVLENREIVGNMLGKRRGSPGGGGHGEAGGGGGGHGESGGDSAGSGGHSSAPSGYSSKSSSFTTSSGKVSAYGAGTSSRSVIPAGQVFAGRNAGGALRGDVYGSRSYGSGYIYGNGGSYVAGRAFPFGFWPVYYGEGYYGDDEYGPQNNASRPGGVEATAIILSNGTTYPTTDHYHIVGDVSSVQAVLDALIFNCSVVNTTLIAYDPSNYSQPQPEQAVQYYRASSFVLFADAYNNTAALRSNEPTSNSTNVTISTTPLPPLNATFLQCLNVTIGNSVPMANAASAVHMRGVGLIVVILLLLVSCCHA